jgi:hypothetical protein
MGEPVTTGMMIGAALGGGTSALRGKNPIEGALMGGLTGGIGGGISGGAMGGSSSPFSLGSILNGIGTNAAAGGDPAKGLAMNAAALAGSGGGFGGGGYGSVGVPSAGGGYGAGGESLFGFEPSIGGFGQGVTEELGRANKWMNQNPVTSQIAFQTASNLMKEEPVHYAQPGQISRGQIQPVDYMSLLNPQGQSVMRPQPISLL